MKSLVTELDFNLQNDNLPELDLRVDEYLAALGDTTYKSAVNTMYGALKQANLIEKFDVLMPILGNTVDKCMLNLMDTSKKVGYNSSIQASNNSIYASSDGDRVAGSYDDIDYNAADKFAIISVFKRRSADFGSIFKFYNAANFFGQANKNYYYILGSYKSFTVGEVGNVYINAIRVTPYGESPDEAFNYTSGTGSDFTKYSLHPNNTISPVNKFEAPATLMARSELMFFAIIRGTTDVVNNDISTILPIIKSFVQATKDVTFAPNLP